MIMEYARRKCCNMLLTLRDVIVELVLKHGNVHYIILVDAIQMFFDDFISISVIQGGPKVGVQHTIYCTRSVNKVMRLI